MRIVYPTTNVLGYSHRAWIWSLLSHGAHASHSHTTTVHTHHGCGGLNTVRPLTSSFACHNNSSRTSYTMSESEIRSQTRHKYPTCIRACVIVHMRLQQSQHGPLRASRRLRGTSVRNTTQEPRSTHLCATHASAHDGATHASKAHLGPRTRGVNILQPVTPHSTPLDGPNACNSRVGRAGRDNHLSCWYGKRIPCKRISSGKRTQAVPKLEEGFVGKRTACMRGFRQDRMQERVSSGPHARGGFRRRVA